MKLEDQVITLKQAKLFREIGITQDSLWYHGYYINPTTIGTGKDIYHKSMYKEILENNEGDNFDISLASAFTVAELGVMLDGSAVTEMNISGKWQAYPPRYIYTDNQPMNFRCDTEAECRAMALLFLIDRKILSVDKINER